MIKTNFHTHTCFSDGAHTPEQMVLEAIELGMAKIGFSDHSYTFFDETYCIPKNRMKAYTQTIRALKEKYRDKIEILCGVEQDYYSDLPREKTDYMIGSVHYLKLGEQYIPVDENEEILQSAIRDYFCSDALALAECYFETLADVVSKTHCDIIGHFDLVALFNGGNSYFDESHPRYVAAYRSAADALCAYDIPFEINTRALYRGKRDVPYPAPPIADYIAQKGGKFILSSDAHAKEQLLLGFEQVSKYAREKGYPLITTL